MIAIENENSSHYKSSLLGKLGYDIADMLSSWKFNKQLMKKSLEEQSVGTD